MTARLLADGELDVSERDGVIVLALNRPAQRNAMTLAIATAVADVMDEFDDRDDLSVGVLTGGGGVFCAGMDLKRFALGERPRVPGRGFGGIAEQPPRKPLIAAVEGWALAGGFELVLACDLVVAGRGARFGLPEVTRGLAAAAGGLLRLPQRLPRNVAMEMILTGESYGAEELAVYGFVNRLVEDGSALDEALGLAQAIAGNAPLALRISKEVVRRSADWPVGRVFELQRPLVDQVLDSEDAREGAVAFAEKRRARWRGR
jgi:enoyl-CoA hydratase